MALEPLLVRCGVANVASSLLVFPTMMHHKPSQERSHSPESILWLRERVKSGAASLKKLNGIPTR